jgi:FixJ family two-component response regulator
VQPSHPISPAGRQPDLPLLIVDDSELVARGLQGLFKHAGYQTALFTQGLAAVEFARRQPAAGAIIDIHLPDISGLVLSQRLREILGPAAPIVVVSGDSSMEVLNSLPHVGATSFFRKPVAASSLLEHFRGLLDPSGGGGPSEASTPAA